jgi:EAL domain-containing protein (putative c-di-GMP-specific phosphodiesterase class I)/GGDEF domain-containing protein
MFASVGAIVALVVLFVSFATSFIIDMKMEQLKENSDRVENMYRLRRESDTDLEKTVESIQEFLEEGEQICIVDENGNILVTSGMEYPDFSTRIDLNRSQDFSFYQDRIGVNIVSREDFNLSLYKIVTMSISGLTQNGKGWMQKEMLRASCWFGYPAGDGSGMVYIREVFSVGVQEAFYISLAAVAVMVILCVFICLLFINFIINIINQRSLLNQLYTDIDTEGNSWVYYIVSACKILAKRANRKRRFAVVAVHLCKYRDYCTCYGLEAGIAIIKSINGYFKVKLDRDETYARHSSADFALLLRYKDRESLEGRMNCIITELMGLGSEQRLIFTAGAYVIGAENDSENAEGLPRLCNEGDRRNFHLEQAYNYAYDATLKAPRTGANRALVFSEGLIVDQLWERKIEDHMEQALRNGEFQVYYQPKYDPTTNRLVAAEALVRWISPTEGRIMPDKFIPLFERNGFISKLDDYMFSSVARQQAEWKIKDMKTVPVSVNLSRAHFVQDDLANSIAGIVDSYGIDHKLVEVEITESAFVDNKGVILDTVNALRAKGFTVSMDDFGSVYSSLNTLKDLPLDIVKIDKEFFSGDVEKGNLIVSSVIRLAKSLKMKIVAEGVEVKEQVDFLARENCDMIQGYYYAKPMPVKEFEELVARDA